MRAPASRPHRSRWVRLWHWSTAACFFVLVASGVVLHGFAPATSDWYALAVDAHDISGYVLAAAYLLYLAYAIGTGHWRAYLPRRQGLGASIRKEVGRHLAGDDTRRSHDRDAVSGRFTALQQSVYAVVVYGLLPLLIVTGLLYLYYPDLVPGTVLGWPAVVTIALLHFAFAVFATAYLIVHVYLAILGAGGGEDIGSPNRDRE